MYRGELDWRDCQYGKSEFAVELIEEILAVWQMVGSTTSNPAGDLLTSAGPNNARHAAICARFCLAQYRIPPNPARRNAYAHSWVSHSRW